ncbi:MAG: TIGR03016 family PEP-CTERM system-associated outer membrane protein [Litorilituus sp.]|nr:TIGR03016 family PEP-CTERM system-associated outer membrane protein [Litorilituus sp.]
MATTATVMVRKHNKKQLTLVIPLFFAPYMALAGKWTFEPSLGLTETYSNNVEFTPGNHQSSIVSQLMASIDTKFTSREMDFSLSGTETYAIYSHNSDANGDFQTGDFKGSIFLWPNGPTFITSSNLTNISKNRAKNALADLVSGNTIQKKSHSTGFQYQSFHSSYNFNGSVIYSLVDTEDNVGESKGYTAIVNTENGNAARHVFWQLNGQFSEKENKEASGRKYAIEAGIGVITSFKLNPFLRYFDEDISGNVIGAKQTTTRSWGPAIRWLVSDHFYMDISHNYVADKAANDDYVATNINWQPSQRTSLKAGYSQRFFGDAYNLDLQHRTRRLSNTISYNEIIEVFDRNTYKKVDRGLFWCPIDVTIDNISQCFVQAEQPEGEYKLGTFFTLEPVENNEFSLNKRFAWQSKLQLSRTTFAFNTTATRRESIVSKRIDDILSAALTINRKISGRSSLTFLAKFDYNHFNKDSIDGDNQKDHYRTFSATYTKKLASSLSTHFTVQHTDRNSNNAQYSYDEVRTLINITKDF